MASSPPTEITTLYMSLRRNIFRGRYNLPNEKKELLKNSIFSELNSSLSSKGLLKPRGKYDVSSDLNIKVEDSEPKIFVLEYKDSKLELPTLSLVSTLLFSLVIKKDDKDKDDYINFFSSLLECLIYGISLNLIHNTKIVKFIVKSLNEEIGEERYIIINCKDELNNYTCGRVVMPTTFIEDDTPSKILVSNTTSSSDDTVDGVHLVSLNEDKKLIEGTYDVNFYYKKYLKYKSKYTNLLFKITK